MSSELYYVWLSRAMGCASPKLKKILDIYSEPEEFYKDRNKYTRCSFLTKANRARIERTDLDKCKEIIGWCGEYNNKILCYNSPLYPQKLKDIYNPPAVLYYAGDISCLSGTKCVGIVGTRHASSYCFDITRTIAERLAGRGFVVISGCAAGIDTAAHKGAIESGRTVAVLGTPLERDYPKGSYLMKRDIIKKGGLVITEYPPKSSVNKGNFPIRNRIIAALSDVLAVTQAGEGSGALITASAAIDMGKEIFCLPPADIESECYSGVKSYLRQGAKPLLGVQDILNYFSIEDMPENDNYSVNRKKLEDVSENAKMVYNALDTPLNEDALVEKLHVGVAIILQAETELELKGLIKHVGGVLKRA